MKKIITLTLLLLMASNAHAEKLLITYNENGTLSSVTKYDEKINYPITQGFSAFIYDLSQKTLSKSEYLPKEEPPKEPEQETNELPEIYEKGIDAISAFGIVADTSRTFHNDSTLTQINLLYQGKETILYIEDDVLITSAPDYHTELIGLGANALKKGDVINITASLSGNVRGIGVIARIGKNEIITEQTADYGIDFQKLYSAEGFVSWGSQKYPINRFGIENNERVQYQFGVVCEKKGDYYAITNKNGKESELTYITILPETIVYTCDIGKNYNVSLARPADITKSYIPASDKKDGDIINWSSDIEYTYALSRTVNNIATDVVVFRNLK